MEELGDDQTLIAKARAAGPPSDQAWQLLNTSSSESHVAPQSWRDAARSVFIKPRAAHPKIREFERSVLPSLRTLRAQFVCDICPHCTRPVIQSVLPDHVAKCEQRHGLAQLNGTAAHSHNLNGTALNHGRANGGNSNGSSTAMQNGVKLEEEWSDSDAKTKKKRGADTTNDSVPAPKKAKTTAKAPKVPKSKPVPKTKQTRQAKQTKEKTQPVYNPDKNCGVLLPTGQPCMRSLTCKAHSMAQKRAVQGRTAAYDVMLGNYQRQHQARQQQQQQTLTAAQAAQVESDQQLEAQAQQNPEREVQQVMVGMARVYCPPLDRKVIVHSQARSKNFRLREMLALALLPRRLAPTGDALFGRSLAFRPDAPEVLSPVRAPAVQQAIYLAQAQQLKMQQQQQLRQQQQQQQQQQQESFVPQSSTQAVHAERMAQVQQTQRAQQNQPSQDSQGPARSAGSQMQAQAHAPFPQNKEQQS